MEATGQLPCCFDSILLPPPTTVLATTTLGRYRSKFACKKDAYKKVKLYARICGEEVSWDGLRLIKDVRFL
jgi:hypothetical protein